MRSDKATNGHLGQTLTHLRETGHECQIIVTNDGRILAYVDQVAVDYTDDEYCAGLAEGIMREAQR